MSNETALWKYKIPRLLQEEDVEKIRIKYSDNEEITALIFRCKLMESLVISSSERESKYQDILLKQGLKLDEFEVF